jgi:D-alanine-D-alanine ligase
MRIAILHQAVPEDATPDEQDVLVQVKAVSQALCELGHSTSAVACTLALDDLRRQLQDDRPDVIFNLVESLAATDSLQPIVPLLVESLGIRMTGSSAAAILNSGRKDFAKLMLERYELPTPFAFTAEQAERFESEEFRPRWMIIKPIAEHASFGMTDDDVVWLTSKEETIAAIQAKAAQIGRPCFAEMYIDGREFNLSLFQKGDLFHALPAAEMRFVDFPGGKPKIVGSAAKWDEKSFEYRSTVRSFEFRPEDETLHSRMASLASHCCRVLELGGYARVDFRVDEHGEPWILEANANPCLSPDAGFAAAAEHARIPYHEMIGNIVDAAFWKIPGCPLPSPKLSS